MSSPRVEYDRDSDFARTWLRMERRNEWWARKIAGRKRYQRRYLRIYRERWQPGMGQVPK
jgi:hypothetical protein